MVIGRRNNMRVATLAQERASTTLFVLLTSCFFNEVVNRDFPHEVRLFAKARRSKGDIEAAARWPSAWCKQVTTIIIPRKAKAQPYISD